MSTSCRLYVDYTICRLYVYFSLYKSIQLYHISITTTGVTMDCSTTTNSTPTPSIRTHLCRRLWKLDKLCEHGVIRCIVCRTYYKHKDILCIHNINDIEEVLHRIGQTLE